MQIKPSPLATAALSLALTGIAMTIAANEPPPLARDANADRRLQAVVAFADNVLEKGRDRWSGQETPLLPDGLNVETGEPVEWVFRGDSFIVHNLASQQNLFRTLAGLTNLLGEERYKRAATEAIRYHFDHLRAPCGKLRWGGHQFIDLRTLEPVGHFDANCHEFKRNFPFYELMWEVDQEATAQFIRALWAGHVSDWRRLEMNRHAPYGRGEPPTATIWEQEFDNPGPFFESGGLSFLNAGADLIYAGGMLYGLAGEQGALDWALRMRGMYAKACHPETGMGAYQYTKPRRRVEPPPDGPLEGRLTYSSLGDRLENQFGMSGSDDPADPLYNPIKGKVAPDGMLVAREGWAFRFSGGAPWYAYVQLFLAETLGGGTAMELAHDAADHLEAHARHAYDPEINAFRAMWADGTDVTGLRIPRTGYHGREGAIIRPTSAGPTHLMAYARAYRLTGRSGLWETARHMAKGLGLGDIGPEPGGGAALHAGAPRHDPETVFALLELHRAAPDPAFVQLACRVADRMVERRFHGGFFLPTENHVHANFDAIEPLAILKLEAVLRGEPEKVPAHVGGRGFIHGRFDGLGRTYDSRAIWGRTREAGE